MYIHERERIVNDFSSGTNLFYNEDGLEYRLFHDHYSS